MGGILGFVPEGCREIGRKINRLGVRRRLGALDRQRRQVLALVGRSAWQARLDLSPFADLRDQIARLDGRAGELATTAARLESRRVELRARRAAEEEKFEAVLKPAVAKQAASDASLRAARGALAAQDQAIREAEARQARAAAELAKLTAAESTAPAVGAPTSAPAGGASAAVAAALRMQCDALPAQIASAKAAREPLAADVARLAAESQRCGEEVSKIQADRKAAIAPVDAELKSVQDEAGRTTRETAGVAREQDERFAALGAALYEGRIADPTLAEAMNGVARLDQERATAQGQMDASLALTRAMARGTMLLFWGAIALVALAIVVVPGLVGSRSDDSAPGGVTALPATPEGAGGVGFEGLAAVAAEESRKDAAVRRFLESPHDPASRKEGVEILARDLADLGSTADRSHLPNLARIARGGEPELRAAAVEAIGMIGPMPGEVPLLVGSLNDPVPAVSNAARRVLREVHGDPAVALLVRRANASGAEAVRGNTALQAVAVPDASRLGGVPVYPGATFLHWASDLENGRASFTSADPAQKVIDFYASTGGRPVLGGEDFSRQYLGASPGDPTGAKRLSAEHEAWFKNAAASGRSSAELEAQSNQLAARFGNLPLVRYVDDQLYASARFIPLDAASPAAGRVRFVAVFDDRALGRTGFDIHYVPASKRP